MADLSTALMRIVAALETQPGLERWDCAIEACDEGMLEAWEKRFWAERNEQPLAEKDHIDKECWLLELLRMNLQLRNRAGALTAAHQATRAVEFENQTVTLPEDTGAWLVEANSEEPITGASKM